MITPDDIHAGDLIEVILPDRNPRFCIVEAEPVYGTDGTVTISVIDDPEFSPDAFVWEAET